MGGSSSSRELFDTVPAIRTGRSSVSRSRFFCHTSPKTSVVAVPWKSSIVRRAHSRPSLRAVRTDVSVMTQGTSTFRSRRSRRFVVFASSA